MTLILGTHIKEDKNKAYKFYSDLHEHDVTHKTIVHARTHTIFFFKERHFVLSYFVLCEVCSCSHTSLLLLSSFSVI